MAPDKPKKELLTQLSFNCRNGHHAWCSGNRYLRPNSTAVGRCHCRCHG